MTELYIFSQDDELLTVLSEPTGLIEAPFEDLLNTVSDDPFKFTVEAETVYEQGYDQNQNLTQVASMFIGASGAIGTIEKKNVSPAQFVVERNRVVFRDREGEFREFVIDELDDQDGVDGALTTATCLPAWLFELQKNYVVDRRFQDKEAQVALDAALDGSRYVGEVEVSLGRASTNFYHMRSHDAIWKILDVWGGEFKDVVELNDKGRIKTRKILIKARRGGDNGLWLEIGHNIEEIERTLISDPITAVYGWGASLEIEDEEGNKTGGHTRFIDFKDVEWKKSSGDPVDKPKGQAWVGDPDALQKYGLNHDGQLIHLFGEFSNQDYETPEELLAAAWDYLQKNKDPEVNYKLSVDLLNKPAQLGDTARALDRKFARPIEIQTRIIGIKYDLLAPDDTAVVQTGQFLSLNKSLGNEIDDLRNELNDTRGKAEQANKPIDDDRFPDITPKKPTGVEATGLFKYISVEWDYIPNSYIAAYEVYASRIKGFTPGASNLVFRGKAGGYIHKANTDQQWYFRVRAVNTHGTPGPFSDEVSAQTVQIGTVDIAPLTITNELIAEDISADKIVTGTLRAIDIDGVYITGATIEGVDLYSYDPNDRTTYTHIWGGWVQTYGKDFYGKSTYGKLNGTLEISSGDGTYSYMFPGALFLGIGTHFSNSTSIRHNTSRNEASFNTDLSRFSFTQPVQLISGFTGGFRVEKNDGIVILDDLVSPGSPSLLVDGASWFDDVKVNNSLKVTNLALTNKSNSTTNILEFRVNSYYQGIYRYIDQIQFLSNDGYELLAIRSKIGGTDLHNSIRLKGLEYYTGSASPNLVISDNWNVYRSTSSIKYKSHIEDIEEERAEDFFQKARPVWFKGQGAADPEGYSFYGYIAEEIADIDPRLAMFNGDEPEGVAYDRVPAMLHVVMKKDRKRLNTAEDEINWLQMEHQILKQRIDKLERGESNGD